MSTVSSDIPFSASTRTTFLARRFIANYLSTLVFIGLSYWMVTRVSNFHRGMLQSQWQLGMFGIDVVITVHAVFVGLLVFYALALIPYYAAYPWMHSKSLVFLRGIWLLVVHPRSRTTAPPADPMQLPLKRTLTRSIKQAGLALLLKFFFAPLMINWCLGHAGDLAASLIHVFDQIREGTWGRMLFDSTLFWAAFQLILFIDTLLFTLGYLIELPALRNRIRSVDPTFFGWFICLACYPPFNDFTMRWLPWQSADFPFFGNTAMHLAVNITLLVALAVFSWASIALGFKASNLTNRGIVTHGPYAFVRHPAYAAKNLAWWLGALPGLLMTMQMGNVSGFFFSLFALFGWTAIYALRAITEERHLLMGGNGYSKYMKRVRWRFIPGLL
ncbi:protein-S-isoprenylcysteine O-methyltransferase Ste14 [Povalibacter uvarum]|uniref:Protein-S-isoprenylcysteine O-methyltransferase Ste14 n=1 Tax=Povalibacter uvarum TaxID=732238 RepID=A0A841HN64_9GAMM|nr:isoprenylcysteine carboxylmethyltransferase family protein [Povalibacter uvarum]MBB6094721.1 protein-S-isoprenylcysteine O-methyltransferase Ste14 [Povalibacter uvarum]